MECATFWLGVRSIACSTFGKIISGGIATVVAALIGTKLKGLLVNEGVPISRCHSTGRYLYTARDSYA
jgi:hypothetical protein